MTHTSDDMFGYRTPSKEMTSRTNPSPREEENRKLTGAAGPSIDTDRQETSNVRRSVGEIESRRVTPPRPKKPEELQLAEKPKQKSTTGGIKITFSQKTRATNVLTETSPNLPKQYKSRTAEAKACLLKAKIQIDKSRNLKTDIKAEVVEAVERLYVLVKEAEEAKAVRIPTPTKQTEQTEQTDQENLATQLREHAKLLKESTRKIDELREELAKPREQALNVTYASVAANQNIRTPPNRRETLHSVVVTSTDETETGEEVLDHVRKAVDAKDGWITVQKVRKAKDRKIIMGFKTKEDQNKVKERIEKVSKNLVVEEVKNKDPLLVLKDVLLVNSDEDVLKALKNQNKCLFQNLEQGEDRVEIKFRKRARNPHTGHIIISTSPKIWRRAVDAGALHIDLQLVRVADQSPLVQCTRCLAYGHGRRFCKEAADLCSHCGGLHMRAQCPEWLANTTPTCRNCTRAKLDHAEHNAFSGDCPVRKRWDTIARSAVAYC